MINKVEVVTKTIDMVGWTVDPKSDMWVLNGNQQAYNGAMKARSEQVCEELNLIMTKSLAQVPPNRKIKVDAQIVLVISEDE